VKGLEARNGLADLSNADVLTALGLS
jgi:hypothetical protein